MRTAFLGMLLVALAAPGPAQGYGEEVDGFPSMEERQIHLFTDMLRVEPMVFWDGEETYDPMRPLIYDADLNEAAYAHAHDMRTNGCFSHESCDGTSMEARVSSYYPGWMGIGENIAMGHTTPYMVVFDEQGWLYSDGHRANMLHEGWTELGCGYDAGGGGGPWYVQDFGTPMEPEEEPYLTSGAHWPAAPPIGSTADFYVAYYHPSGDAPESIWVAVDDSCHEMELDVGSPEMGIYRWELSDITAEGCVPYAFFATLSDGEQVLLPSQGAQLMPAGGAECDGYRPEPPPAPCTDDSIEEAGGCAAQQQGCDTGTDSTVVTDNDVETTEYGTCDQGRRAVRNYPFPAILLCAGVFLCLRRLLWSGRLD